MGTRRAVSRPRGEGNESVTHFGAGRVVLDEDGVALSLQMWDEPKDADPPFGPGFDDA